MKKWLLLVGIMIIISSCDSGQVPPQATAIVLNKVLATVYISPTANAQQEQATRQASSATPTPLTPTPTARATAYIGIFIGEAEALDVALIDPDAFASISTPLAPTVVPANCTIQVDPAYSSVWRTDGIINQRMGCPIQIGVGFFGEVQVFENGVMYRHTDTGEIWAIVPNSRGGDYYYVDVPTNISTAGISAPVGMIVPADGFGGVWSSIPGLSTAIGFAQTPPLQIEMGYQRFSGGTFLLDDTSGQVFALVVDGTAFGPFLADLTSSAGVNPDEGLPATETTATEESASQ